MAYGLELTLFDSSSMMVVDTILLKLIFINISKLTKFLLK